MRNRTICVAIFWLIVMLFVSQVNAAENIIFELVAKQQTIKVGEPLTIDVVFSVPESYISELPETYDYDIEFFYVEKEGVLIGKVPSFFDKFKLNNSQDRQYKATAVLFYDWLERKLLFEVPSNYSVRFGDLSTILTVNVEKPSNVEELALSLISDPNDYFFLGFGSRVHGEKHSETILHLEEVVKRCPETVLAKWCAARLGLEYFKDFEKKHRSIMRFRSAKTQGQIQEPLFDKAHLYLTKGAALPDDFPIREEVLLQLGVAEFINNDLIKANSILDELASNYPNSEYGKQAVKSKAELQEIQHSESAQPKDPNHAED